MFYGITHPTLASNYYYIVKKFKKYIWGEKWNWVPALGLILCWTFTLMYFYFDFHVNSSSYSNIIDYISIYVLLLIFLYIYNKYIFVDDHSNKKVKLCDVTTDSEATHENDDILKRKRITRSSFSLFKLYKVWISGVVY